MNMRESTFFNLVKRVIAFAMVISMVFYSIPFANISTVARAGSSQFNVNLSSIGAAWVVSDATISDGTIYTTGQGNGMLAITITDEDLQNAIDLGTVSMSSVLNVSVEGLEDQDPLPENLHNTVLSVRFGVDVTSALSSSPAASQSHDFPSDDSVQLSANANIPSGTRCILISGDVTTYEQPNSSVVTTTFTSSNTVIPDGVNPTISSSYETAWTQNDILVTISASDTIGVKGIYSSADTLLASGGQYTYTVTEEGDNISSFYAMDFAGNISQTINVNVNNIDKTNPSDIQAPTLSAGDWTNETVTVTFDAIAQPANASPETYQFSADSGANYSNLAGNVHTVMQQGEQTWTYRKLDEAGNASANTVSVTTKYDATEPVINNISTSRTSGENKYTISVSDAHSGIASVKYAVGEQNKGYFASNGTELAVYEIVSDTAQSYTVYVEDVAGNSTIQVIPAQNILPSIGAIADVTIDEDNSTTVDLVVSDDTTALADFIITATSSDTSIVGDAAGYLSAGALHIDIQPVANAYTDGTPVTMTVSCQDENGESVTTTFKVTVNPVNDKPVANPDSQTIDQNDSYAFDVLANDTDVDDSVLTIQSFTQGGHGSVVKNAENNLVYTPNHNWAGVDTFTYVITDGNLTSTATVTVTVTNINDAPNANDDSAQTTEDNAVDINVLANDSDADIGIDPAESLVVAVDPSYMPAKGTATVVNNVIHYEPNENAFGTDTFKYILTDTSGAWDVATVTVTINPENDDPIISNLPESVTVDEDSIGNTFTFTIWDIETSMDDMMVQVVSMNKALIKNEDIAVSLNKATGVCTVTFAPLADVNGNLNLKILLSDGITTIPELLPITITPANDAPVAYDDDMTDIWKVYEDTSKSLDLSVLTDNDLDKDGDSLTVISVSNVSAGTFTKTSGETYTYKSAANAHGVVTFTYTVSDGNYTDTATVTFEVRQKDDPPVLTLSDANVYECEEDNFTTPITVSASDIDTDLSHLFLTVESDNETLISSDNIIITNNGDGTYSISLGLTEHKNGSTNLTIYLSDGINTVSETVKYTVTPVQDAPVAQDDEYEVGRGTREYIIPIANDFDYDDEALSLKSFTQPGIGEGTVAVQDRGFIYTAPTNQVGDFTFTYTITDGIDDATATVTLHVIETDEIEGPSISAIADRDEMQNRSIDSVAFTVVDADGIQSVTASSSDGTIIPNSDLSITNNGSDYTLSFANKPTVTGTTYITITATDNNGHASQRQFAVTVYPENETPIANDDTLPASGSAYEDNVFSFTADDLLGNDTDAENDNLSIIFVGDPNGAQSYITGDGKNYELHPSPNQNGAVTFTYQITDGFTTSSPATVTVNLLPVNDRPDGDDDYYTLANTTGAEQLIITAPGVLANDDDVDGDVLTVDINSIQQPQYGTVTLNADGSFTYTRTQIAPGEYGADSFTYYVTDGTLTETNPTTVHIQADYKPDFYIYHRSRTCREDDEQFSISIPVGEGNGYSGTYIISDITGSDLGAAVAGPGSGTDLSILYTPNPDVNGDDTFTYEVTDTDTGTKKTNTVYIRIIPENDAPTFVLAPESEWEENEDGSKTLSIQVADADHDIDDLEIEVYLTNQSNSNPIALDEDIIFTQDPLDKSKATAKIPFLPNKNGTFSVVFNVTDGIDSTTATSNGTVLPVDDPPQTPDREDTLKEDTSTSIEIMDYVSDIDTPIANLVLTITSTTPNGTAQVSGTEILYTPDLNFDGEDELTYRVSSQDGTVYNEGKVKFIVEGENDDPYVYDIDYYVVTDEDTGCTVNFMAFDYEDDASDTDDKEVTYTFTTNNDEVISLSGITMSVDPNDSSHKILTIEPNANMFGIVNLQVIATDSDGAQTIRDFVVKVVSVNDLPNAVADSAEVDEDSSVEINVLANDTDIEDNESDVDDLELSVIEVSECLHGKTVINNQTGIITYTPDANYNGPCVFTYKISDSFGDIAEATVTITVNPVNDPPVAEDDEGNVLEGGTITIDLLANDWDTEILDGESVYPLVVVSNTASQQGGTISIEDGILTYTAPDDLDDDVVDTFQYTITDSAEGTETAVGTITINIEQVNDPPEANNDEGNNIGVDEQTWTFDEDTVGVFIVDIKDSETLSNQLLVSLSSDGDDQGLVADSNISMENTATFDKEITIIPYENAYGTFNITFTVSDGDASTTVVFPVEIVPVNDLPELTVHDLSTAEEVSVGDTATAEDVETEDGSFLYSISTQAANGTAVINPATGNYTYTPNADFTGSDSFEITVTDEDGGQDTKLVNVDVTQINDPPVAVVDNYTIDESQTSDFDVLSNDSDPDTPYGDSITIVSVTQPAHGTVTTDGTQIHYVPEDYNNNTVTFTYTIKDNSNVSSTATVTVNFVSLDNDPSNGNDTFTIDEDDPVAYFDVLANDDVDIDPTLNDVITDSLTLLTVTPANAANSDICEIELVDGKYMLKYKPALNYFGTDTITYTMKDANTPDGTWFTFTVAIIVQSINDIPTISDIADETAGNDEDNDIVTSADISDVETAVDDLVVTASWDNDTLINDVVITTTGATRTITVKPETNMSGTALITVKVADEDGGESTDTFTVTIDPVNDNPDPTKEMDYATTDENTAVYIDVLKNDDVDANLEGDTLHIESGSIVLESTTNYGGSFSIVPRTVERTKLNDDGTTTTVNVVRDVIKYVPNADWTESAPEGKKQLFTYQMYEESNPSVKYDANRMVEITILPVNDTPTIDIDLVGDVTDFDEDTVSASIDIIVNDEEDNNGTLTVEIESITEHEPNSLPDSPLVLATDITINTTADDNIRELIMDSQDDESGVFDLQLRITDSEGLVSYDTITVTVNPTQDAPSNGDDLFTTAEDTPITLDVLENDDVDTSTQGSESTLIGIENAPSHGTAVKVGNQVLYTPDEHYYNDSDGPDADDTFQYRMEDGNGAQAVFTVTMYVTPVNDDPVLDFADDEAPNDDFKVSTPELTTRVIKLYFTDVDDVDGDIQMTGTSSNPLIINDATGGISISGVKTDGFGSYFEVTLTPFGKWNGKTNLTFTATDPTTRGTGIHLAQSIQTVELTINPVNDAPDAITDDLSGNEGNTLTLDVLRNDQDIDIDTNPDGDELHIVSANFAPGETNTHVGTISLNADNSKIIFTPSGAYMDWNGILEIEYTISDLGGLTDTVISTLTINQVNDDPQAFPDTATVDEDSHVDINILQNDTDIDMDASLNNMPYTEFLSYTDDGFEGVENGTVTRVNDTTIRFTPTANFNGEEEFTYTLKDNNGSSVTGTVTITVNPLEDAPTAVDDSATTAEETTVTINVLANDSDIDSDTDLNKNAGAINNDELNITHIGTTPISVGNPVTLAHGTVYLVEEAGQPDKLEFEPSLNYIGQQTFKYTIKNMDTNTAEATVTVTITNVNDAPTAGNTAKTIDEDDVPQTFDIDFDGLDLIDDVDLDVASNNEELTVTIDSATVAGDVALNNTTNVITYTPQVNWNGEFVITYRVTDKAGLSDTGTITITVNPIVDDPTAVDDTATTAEETTVTINVLANDSDIDSDTDLNKNAGAINNDELNITHIGTTPISVGNPVTLAHGTVYLVEEAGQPDKLEFEPSLNYIGQQTFKYTIKNMDTNTAEATVTVTITNVNDAPTAGNTAKTIDEDEVPQTFDIDFDGLDLIDDVDLDVASNNEELTVTIDSATVAGDVALNNATNVITYTPQANWNGEFVITYRVTDKAGLFDTGTVTITVNPLEDDPTAVDDSATTAEETTVTINVLANDSDIDSDTDLNKNAGAINNDELNITHIGTTPISVGNPVTLAHGTVYLVEEAGQPDKLEFEPSVNYIGQQTFKYTIKNMDTNTAEATVTVTITNVNDAPTAGNTAKTIDEDEVPQTFDIDFDGLDLIDDVDLDVASNNEELTVTIDSATVADDVALNNATNVITYTPQVNWNGEFVITYRVTDKAGLFDTGTITITVTPTGDAPVLNSETYTIDEDEYTPSQATKWYNMDVLANDTDVDETTNAAFEDLKITDVVFNENNVRLVTATDKKSINFQSDENWNGIVNFIYTVTDAYGISRSIESTVIVNQVYDAPVAVDDTASTDEDNPVTFSIIGNDSDVDTNPDLNLHPENDGISINEIDVVGVANGIISLTNGVLTYTPNANFNGVEHLTYTLLDEHGGTATAKITINVVTQLDDPQAVDDAASLNEDDDFKDILVLVNDYNPDSDPALNAVPDTRPLKIQSIDLSTMPQNAGEITIVDDDYLHYVPQAHYEGTFTITYTCVNGNGGEDTATVTIYVAQVYDNPDAQDIAPIMDEDTIYTLDINDIVSDVDQGTTFNVYIITEPQHGTASLDPVTHVLTYTPIDNYNGVDLIEYMVEDNQHLTDNGTINITINQVNDAPITADDSKEGDEDTAVTINVIKNDSDIDTDPDLNANPNAERIIVDPEGFRGVENGTVKVLSNGTSIVFKPDSNWHGTEIFRYTCIDVTGEKVEAKVTITINPVEDIPVFNSVSTTLNEDSSKTYTATELVFDPDIKSNGDEITLSIVTHPSEGTLEIVNNSKVIYTPRANFNGDDKFTIKVKDKDGNETTKTFNMVVNQVNDIPKAVDDSIKTDEDTPVMIEVLPNDSDIDMQSGLNKYPNREDIEIKIGSLSSPENGSVSISADDKTMIEYTPNENFNGIDGFDYTIVDNSGATSTAHVDIFVNAVDDIPELIRFTIPYAGNAYKSSHRLDVAWEVYNPDNIKLLYTLSFFDGSKWIVIGADLTAEEYTHLINDYITETDKAQFKAVGFMEDGTETNTIYSDVFIVDNVAPINTKYNVTPVGGALIQSMLVDVYDGADLIEFEYLYQVGEDGDMIVIENDQFIMGRRDEVVNLYAQDRLGNIRLVDTIKFSDYRNYGSTPWRSNAVYGSSLFVGLLLLFLLLRYRNIKFIFEYADGKTKTVRMYRRHKDQGIDVKLKDKWFEDAVSVEMIMKKRITEKMLGNIVRVSKENQLVKEVVLPNSLRDKYSEFIV